MRERLTREDAILSRNWLALCTRAQFLQPSTPSGTRPRAPIFPHVNALKLSYLSESVGSSTLVIVWHCRNLDETWTTRRFGKWKCFQNFVFSSYFEFLTMKDAHKGNDCVTPMASSEPFVFFRIYIVFTQNSDYVHDWHKNVF
jgi:hypothetical protein